VPLHHLVSLRKNKVQLCGHLLYRTEIQDIHFILLFVTWIDLEYPYVMYQ